MYLNEVIVTRLRKEEKVRVEEVVKRNQDKYENPAHFCRCALLKLLREEGI